MRGSRRKKYLIAPRFQLGLTAGISLFLVVYGTAIVYVGLKPVADLIQTLPFNCLTPGVRERLLAVPREAVLLGLLMVLFVSFQAIRLSHRVAGPVFRLNREIRGMAEGKYPQSITLRRLDHLKELAEALTHLSQGLEGRRQALLRELDAVQGAATECRSRLGTGAPPATLQAGMDRILQHIQTLRGIAAVTSGEHGERPTSPTEAVKGESSESTPLACGRT